MRRSCPRDALSTFICAGKRRGLPIASPPLLAAETRTYGTFPALTIWLRVSSPFQPVEVADSWSHQSHGNAGHCFRALGILRKSRPPLFVVCCLVHHASQAWPSERGAVCLAHGSSINMPAISRLGNSRVNCDSRSVVLGVMIKSVRHAIVPARR